MITYKKVGVNISAGNQLVRRIKKWAPRIGGFSDGMRIPGGFRDPVLIGCADGVGTKLAIAQKLNIHNTIGYDLVGMNVNDLICSGARPLFFLDYFSCGKLNVNQAEKVIRGISKACREAQCQLLGGETAEMPGFYKNGEYDLAGFATGVVSQKRILKPKKTIKSGDILIGLPSSGLHSNGYSLVRKLFSKSEWRSRAKELLRPTRLYVKQTLRVIDALNTGQSRPLKGIVHVTGGGFIENIPRILPAGRQARILMGSWPIPKIFKDIQRRSKLNQNQMFRTFNMGIGLIFAVSPKSVRKARRYLPKSYIIGEVTPGPTEVRFV